MYIQRFFLSHTYLKENVFTKIFNANVYTKVFSERTCVHKFDICTKISKDNVSTNFQRRVYLQKYIYFFLLKEMVNVSCNHYIADFLSPFCKENKKNDWFFLLFYFIFFSEEILFAFFFFFIQWGQNLHNAERISNGIKKRWVETMTGSRNKSWKKWGKCMNAIFFIFDILDFLYGHLGRDAWVHWERINIYMECIISIEWMIWKCIFLFLIE